MHFYTFLRGRERSGSRAISCRIALHTAGIGYKKKNWEFTSLGFSCKLLVWNALLGTILLQVSDERAPALFPGTDVIPIASVLPCQLAGLPEFLPMKPDALVGLHTAETPSSYLDPFPSPFCRMSLQICLRENLLQVFLILE